MYSFDVFCLLWFDCWELDIEDEVSFMMTGISNVFTDNLDFADTGFSSYYGVSLPLVSLL